MDSKEFNQHLAESLSLTTGVVDRLAEALAATVRESLKALDTVAVPSFGSLSAMKYGEKVIDDPSTGKRMLMPPHIDIEFTPGTLLRKHLSGDE